MKQKRVIMIDQERTKWLRNDNQNDNFAPWLILIILLGLGVISMLSSAVKADDVHHLKPDQYDLQDVPLEEPDHLLISTETKSFLKLKKQKSVKDLHSVE